MKAIKILSSALALCLVFLLSQSYAQNAGVAADKQKQANLEKIKKHQDEMKTKYNSMTPEQAAAAKQKADAYKKNGGKTQPTGAVKTTTATTKKAPGSAIKNKTSVQKKTGNVKKGSAKSKPVWLDEKGKPKTTASPAATQQGKAEGKPAATTPIKKAPVKKTTVKSTVPAAKVSTTEKPKK